MPRARGFELPICPICNEPVELTSGKSDGNGRPVHEECFAAKMHREFVARPVQPGTEGEPDKDDNSWRSVAEQVTQETDPRKMIQLTEKLNHILMEEEKQKAGRRNQNRPKPDRTGA